MDIFSHGLWAGAAAKAANKKSPTKLNLWHAAAWGLFPDLFAFAPAFIGLFWLIFTGQMGLGDWPGARGMGEPTAGNSTLAMKLAEYLYNFSHSIFVFTIVFCTVWFVRNKIARRRSGTEGAAASASGSDGPKWEMGGWLLHIIMDIPTHSYAFFPTPVLWPLFGWKFNGFSWATPWFLILNYSLLILVYWLLRERKIGPST